MSQRRGMQDFEGKDEKVESEDEKKPLKRYEEVSDVRVA